MKEAHPTIVVLDGHTLDPGDNPWDEIAALGALAVHPRTPPDLVVERARDAVILLTNKTRLDAAALGRSRGSPSSPSWRPATTW